MVRRDLPPEGAGCLASAHNASVDPDPRWWQPRNALVTDGCSTQRLVHVGNERAPTTHGEAPARSPFRGELNTQYGRSARLLVLATRACTVQLNTGRVRPVQAALCSVVPIPRTCASPERSISGLVTPPAPRRAPMVCDGGGCHDPGDVQHPRVNGEGIFERAGCVVLSDYGKLCSVEIMQKRFAAKRSGRRSEG